MKTDQQTLNQLVIGSNPIGVTLLQGEKKGIAPNSTPFFPFVQDDSLALNSVVTLPMACRLWRKARSHVLLEMNLGRLRYTQQGRIYLITVASLYRRWGRPTNPYLAF